METYTRPEDIQFIICDLFAGAGGTSTGVERALTKDGKKVAVVIAAVNQDPVALHNHELNHPHAYHFIEDVRTLDMTKLILLVKVSRKLYCNAKLILWASAECTYFSMARSGPKDEGSRSLPEALYRYIDAIHPEYVFVENVKEFLDWGPCNENMYPIKDQKGEYYDTWRDEIKSRGYEYSYEVSSSAEVGAYTDRVRYFGAFRIHGLPFSFPVKTHSKYGGDGFKKYKPVRDVLDLDEYGKDIFSKQRSDNTYRRIFIGLEKYTPNSSTFLTQYNGASGSHDVDKPCGTLTTKDRFGKVDVQFIDQQYGISTSKSLEVPLATITATPKQNFVTTQFMDNFQWGGNVWSIDRSCFTLIARIDKAPPSLVSALQESRPDIIFEDDDTPYQRKIKKFMIEHGISMIYMRMLNIKEMLKIMGFGSDYKLEGTITQQKKGIGNAVVCDYSQAWFEALAQVVINAKSQLKLQFAS